ncbi:TraR/DksA family transcriptional regulator [Nocardioides piscis]|uniref:TraR/DksA family transcriptional regulator n=1 Tax=Nocardioides piscis TaxID=2714938 RepID=A0A6G7YCP1_9ACTN|nr:TraR/DksA C4-type zinc finger protein [Nocardioides piscis]QIK74563.1 TraR/DksA family transcriptional regulator [Nocardioides piscis]
MNSARERLAAERRRVLVQLASLTGDYDAVVAASLDTNADDEHDPEGATIAFERSQIGALVRQARLHLAEIDQAQARVDAGTYGVCERCGGQIPEERLLARPIATSCVRCPVSGS